MRLQIAVGIHFGGALHGSPFGGRVWCLVDPSFSPPPPSPAHYITSSVLGMMAGDACWLEALSRA